MKSDLTQNNSAFRIPNSALKNPQKAFLPFAGFCCLIIPLCRKA